MKKTLSTYSKLFFYVNKIKNRKKIIQKTWPHQKTKHEIKNKLSINISKLNFQFMIFYLLIIFPNFNFVYFKKPFILKYFEYLLFLFVFWPLNFGGQEQTFKREVKYKNLILKSQPKIK